MRKWTTWMVIFLTWDPSAIEQSTWQIIWKEITERNFVAQGCKIFWRSHPDHWEQYQTQNCQDDQCGNKHALPVPIWTRMSNQLLKDKQKKCFIFILKEIYCQFQWCWGSLKKRILSWMLCLSWTRIIWCCVFWPGNWCLASCSLVKIIFLGISSSSPVKHNSSDGRAVDYKFGGPEFKPPLWIQLDHFF